MTSVPNPDTVIDIHSHLYVPAYVDFLRAKETPPYVREVNGHDQFMLFPGDHGVTMDEGFTSVEGKLAYMDDVGIDHTVLSLGNPWLDTEAGPHTVALAAKINVELAQAAEQGGPRFSAMGVLPNHDVQSAITIVRELSRSRAHVGIVTSTRVCGLDLDDPELSPLWSEIADSDLPVLVHPVSGLGGEMMGGYGQALTLGLSFPFETTAAVSRMVLAGLFTTHPKLRVIAAHGAGTIPYLLGRLQRAMETDHVAEPIDKSLPPGLYADSILFSAEALRQCLEVFGSGNVMFGTDHPFPIADAVTGLRDVEEATRDHPSDRQSILSGNARDLFRLRA